MCHCLSFYASSSKSVSLHGPRSRGVQYSEVIAPASVREAKLFLSKQGQTTDMCHSLAAKEKKLIWNRISHSLCTFNCTGSSFPPQTLQILYVQNWGELVKFPWTSVVQLCFLYSSFTINLCNAVNHTQHSDIEPQEIHKILNSKSKTTHDDLISLDFYLKYI